MDCTGHQCAGSERGRPSPEHTVVATLVDIPVRHTGPLPAAVNSGKRRFVAKPRLRQRWWALKGLGQNPPNGLSLPPTAGTHSLLSRYTHRIRMTRIVCIHSSNFITCPPNTGFLVASFGQDTAASNNSMDIGSAKRRRRPISSERTRSHELLPDRGATFTTVASLAITGYATLSPLSGETLNTNVQLNFPKWPKKMKG